MGHSQGSILLPQNKFISGNFFYRKSTTGTTIAAIEANNDTYCLQKTYRKVLAGISPGVIGQRSSLLKTNGAGY